VAISEFSKLDHRVPLARAETNRVGNGWNDPLARVARDDPHGYMPLMIPGAVPAPPSPEPPPPPPPSEDELREVLVRAIEAMRSSAEGVAEAETHADLAAHLVENCKAEVASFDGLEGEQTATLIQRLKAGLLDQADVGGRRLAFETSRAQLATAENAKRVLDDDLANVREQAETARKAAHAAAIMLLGIEATALATRVRDLEDETRRMREALLAFDRLTASTGGTLPPVVFDVIGGDNALLMKPVDSTMWRNALAELLADPTAEVLVTIPERRPPAPMPPRGAPTVKIMEPIRRDEHDEPGHDDESVPTPMADTPPASVPV
jgi:hypothetical protein